MSLPDAACLPLHPRNRAPPQGTAAERHRRLGAAESKSLSARPPGRPPAGLRPGLFRVDGAGGSCARRVCVRVRSPGLATASRRPGRGPAGFIFPLAPRDNQFTDYRGFIIYYLIN